MAQLLNARDYRAAARTYLPRALFEYIDRGTEDEHGLDKLRRSFDAINLVPRILTGHAERDLKTTVLGQEIGMPLVVAPTALAGLVAHDGEVKLARAAGRMGIPVCISTQSVTTIEAVRAGAPDAWLWFQLYVWKDRRLTQALLQRVKEAGADILVVTVDTPLGPKREYNSRNGFSIPLRYSARIGLDVAQQHPGARIADVLERFDVRLVGGKQVGRIVEVGAGFHVTVECVPPRGAAASPAKLDQLIGLQQRMICQAVLEWLDAPRIEILPIHLDGGYG